MGHGCWDNRTPAQKRADTIAWNKARKAEDAALRAKREVISAKIAMMVIDHITRDIIRPGPIAEERECYEMAQELRDMQPALLKLVADIFEAEDIHP